MHNDVFEEIWQGFTTGDHISSGSIWGGEGLALIIPIEVPEVLGKIEQIQSQLVEHLPFSPHPLEILHITVYLYGSPAKESTSGLSVYLRNVLAIVPAFWVELKHVNSFFCAPFLEVHDAGALNHLLASIQPGLKELGCPGAEYGPHGQVWHVTLGGYTQSNDGAAARELLKVLREQHAGLIPVNELRLVKTSAGISYQFEVLESFPLAN